GLGFRPAGTFTLPGRTWELRLAVGQCPNSADNASATFASNLPKPTTVFATSTTFSKFSFQTVKGTKDPNPIAFTVPFNSNYIYIPLLNSHFCWEWRYKNATTNQTMPADAIAGRLGRGTIMPSIGAGCGNARSTVKINYRSPNYFYDSTLANAATGARAMAMVGIVKQQTPLPGWCSNLETIPVFHIFGTTNAAGSMTVSGALALLKGVPQLHIYTQYAFVDKSKPFGVGLSDTSVYRTNLPGGWQMSRIYKAAFGGTTNGDELATSGSVGKNYGLVVGFLQ
ncbi:MAG: hypothetical protein ACYTF5_13090, partial [Planctomycetota bacterium]